ncbi:metallophosphoesterase family protein [Paenibacillus sp. ATY16]|uniref:metallophosphoesterase family protein n=1 Tax=Paenibacillus sp. ATY16 TaxID=1759312 RepID=UPI00200EA2F0|nr:metallophosphoesterase family protein [Paenibacillus sp. ATY16]MCK9859017.1 metallophosphoesterase family protein [Paenibacillus sp. ATY16]
MGRQLAFREDGTFKIIQFTDIHVYDGLGEADIRSLALIKNLIESEKPDLIVFTGDVIYADNETGDLRGGFRKTVQIADQSGIPFAVIYGNHDAERNVKKPELQKILSEYGNCISEAGPEDIGGIGNYTATVKSSSSDSDAAVLYFMDSGEYADASIGGYAWIQPSQVQWYREQSCQLAEKNNAVLPGLAFLHIPLPEYNEVWESGGAEGTKGEQVCCSKVNSGLFAALLERGDVMGVFAGHDHNNDYIGTLHGITLAYGRATGYNTYGDLKRGARIITLIEGERRFDTSIKEDAI